MDIITIRALARSRMLDARSHSYKEVGNKYHHGVRTARLALTLRHHILPYDAGYDAIIEAAALFHDIMNGVGEGDHAVLGAKEAREALTPYCSERELGEISAIITAHDDRRADAAYSDYIKIHQDADHLDHFGTFAVWSSFICAVPLGMSMRDVIDALKHETRDRYYEYRNELNYEISRNIYDEKTEFLINFTERFETESGGGIWDEKDLLA